MGITALDNISCEIAPVADSHLANKGYVDSAVAAVKSGGSLPASNNGGNVVAIPAMSLIDCDFAPTENAHLANKGYVDGAIAEALAEPPEEGRGLGVNVVTISELTDAALRNAITGAQQYTQVVIKFASNLNGTLTLTGGEITINGHVIIEGENRITLSGGNASRLFVIPTKTVLTLRDLTITGGNGVGSANSLAYGGAIYFSGNGVLNARGVTFTGNGISGTAEVGGGVIYSNNYSTVYLDNCVFNNNSVATTGDTGSGGCFFGVGFIRAKDCTFSNNSAVGAIASYGGVFCGGYLVLDGCEFTGNTVTGALSYRYGGAIYAVNYTEINNCTFTSNSATSDDAGCRGGAIFTSQTRCLRIDGCTFTGNIGQQGGAVCLWGSNTASYDNTITHCVFDNNPGVASMRGAAIYAYYCDAVIEDCEFKNHNVNTASVIHIYGYVPTNGTPRFYVTINRCKFTGNSGSFTTGGMVYVAHYGQVCLYNTVFQNNTFTASSGNHRCIYTTGGGSAFIQNCTFVSNTGGGAFYASGSGTLSVYNSVEYGNTYTSVKSSTTTFTASKFLSDKDSAGRDITYNSGLPLFAADGFTPVANSQVINKGLSANCDTTIDLLGNTRITGTAVDLGAVEYQG